MHIAKRFLAPKENWTLDWLQQEAEKEGISPISDDHLAVLSYVRVYATSLGVLPGLKIISKAVGLKFMYIASIFPGGWQSVYRLAGVPEDMVIS